MSDNNLWYGYLDAGEKSSPVLMDPRLNTADPGTVYLFNLKRGEIIEYKRAIVDAKLRELKADEQEVANELRSAFRKARNGFTPRGARIANIPEKGRPAKAAQPAVELPAEEGFDDEDYVDDGGDDDEGDEE